MKIIHTADWHLGKLLHNISLLDDQRVVLDQLFDFIVEHSVDLLMVAGDVYDRSIPPVSAVNLLDEFINRLVEINVTVILISGNHDSASRLGFGSKHFEKSSVYVLSQLEVITQPITVEKEGVTVNVYGIPFANPEEVVDVFDEPVKGFDAAHTFLVEKITSKMDSTANNVLMSHCFVDGAAACDSERTLTIGGSDRVSFEPMLAFDYVALGHLHQPQKRGADTIRYSGSLLKYSFSEHTQKKGVTLLEFNNKGLVSQALLRFVPQKDVRVIEGVLEDVLLGAEKDQHLEDYVMVRLLDKVSLLEPMAKLRQVYPNVLHVEKTMLTQALGKKPSQEVLQRGESEMVQDFFEQVMGQTISKAQLSIVNQTIKTLQKEEME